MIDIGGLRRRPGWSHRPEPLPHDRLLHDRPEVRRDPVDEQAGREVDHEDDEDERQREEDDPLRPVVAVDIRIVDSSCDPT